MEYLDERSRKEMQGMNREAEAEKLKTRIGKR